MKYYYITVWFKNVIWEHDYIKNIFSKIKVVKIAYLFPSHFDKKTNTYSSEKVDLYLTSKRWLNNINDALKKYFSRYWNFFIKEWWTIDFDKNTHNKLKKDQPNFYVEF